MHSVECRASSCCSNWLTDNVPGDDQLSTASEARGPSQADDSSVGAVQAGCRPEEPRPKSLRTTSSNSSRYSSRTNCTAQPVRHYGGDGRRKADITK